MAIQAQQILIDSVTKLLRRKADRNLVNILVRTHAADIAAVFRGLGDRDRVHTFALIPTVERRSEVLAHCDPEIAAILVQALDDDAIVGLLHLMSGDDAADIIELLDDERGTRVLAALKGGSDQDLDVLLAYGPDTAGGIMSPHVFALRDDLNVREAIESLQAQHEELETAFYLYVVNDHGHLVGVCSLRELVISDPAALLRDIMTPDVISVDVGTDQEDVARLVHRYSFLAIPVVDMSKRLVGVVTVDDVIDVIREEATEDMLLLAGAGPVDFAEQTSATRSARQRLPYLLASFAGGVGSMLIIGQFEESLQRVTALAAFIPITLGMGGNVGTQAATLVTRGLALGRISVERFRITVAREVGTGALLGVAYGLLLGVLTAVLYGGDTSVDPIRLAATVGLSVTVCMVFAAALGGGAPIFFQRVGVDPALATGPIVTTGVDILGTLIYFLIGAWLLRL